MSARHGTLHGIAAHLQLQVDRLLAEPNQLIRPTEVRVSYTVRPVPAVVGASRVAKHRQPDRTSMDIVREFAGDFAKMRRDERTEARLA